MNTKKQKKTAIFNRQYVFPENLSTSCCMVCNLPQYHQLHIANIITQEESMKDSGTKNDEGKPRMDLLPMDALLEIAKTLTFGAKQYGDRNWEKGIDIQRLRAAELRHDAAHEMGQEFDEESGLPHKAHKACDALMELSLYLRGKK